MTKIEVDFNALDAEGHVRARLSRSNGPVMVGDEVLAYDPDGYESLATVLAVDTDRLLLELIEGTWQEAPDADSIIRTG